MAARVQREDFDVSAETASLGRTAGALCLFVGFVRDFNDGRAVTSMTLEHYPGMTERELERIEHEARARWALSDVLIVHRHGRLAPGDRIVLVAVGSAHRDAAFAACRFIIDALKTRAPIWKAEETEEGRRWVAARPEDDMAGARGSPTRSELKTCGPAGR